MADSNDPVQRYAALFGRAFIVTFGVMMAFDILLAAGLSVILDVSVSLMHGAMRALEVGIPVGLGYATLRTMKGDAPASEKDTVPWVKRGPQVFGPPDTGTEPDAPPVSTDSSDRDQGWRAA
ncbi:MAG TPA: hypothetical protein VH951_14400 [Dehalococcoidia bacterium]|jgi:hypothetical protein